MNVLREKLANDQKSLDKISEQERNRFRRWKSIPNCIPPGFLNMARCKEKTLACPAFLKFSAAQWLNINKKMKCHENYCVQTAWSRQRSHRCSTRPRTVSRRRSHSRV